MSFLSQIFPRRATFDPFEGNPHGPKAEHLLRERQWGALGHLYSALPPQQRMSLVEGLARVWPLDRDLTVDHDLPATKTVLGGMQVALAWRERDEMMTRLALAREAGRTLDTPDADRAEALSRIEDRLIDAERRLVEVTNADPDDPCLWGWLMRTNMALGGDSTRAAFVTEALTACSDRCLQSDLYRLSHHQMRWFGDQGAMWSEIEKIIAPLPSADWLAMVARGHIEDWSWYVDDGHDPDRAEIFKSEAFGQEVAALNKLFWSTAHAEGEGDAADRQFAHNQFAVLFALIDRPELAKTHVEAIGQTPMASPLHHLIAGTPVPDIMDVWGDLQDRCGL